MINADNLLIVFNEYKEIAIFISILISILISLAGILPSVFVTGANIIFFGPIKGFFISLAGETIGGYISFKVYRMGLKKKITKLESKYKVISRLVNSSGKESLLLVFEGRIIPFVPSGFVTIAASLSNICDLYFIVGTFFGKMPSIILESVISYDVINIQENYIRLIFTIVSLLLIYIISKAKRK